ETNHSGGGFFGAGDDVADEIGAFGEQHGDEICAIIHGHLRLVIEGGAQMRVVGIVVFAFDGVSGNTEVAIQRGCDFVLCGERIGRAENDVGAAIAKSDHQIGGFAGDVEASGNAQSLERLLFDEA